MQPQYIVQKTPISLDLSADITTLLDVNTKCVFGTISSKTTEIIRGLREKVCIQVFADYEASSASNPISSGPKKRSRPTDCSSIELSLVLYGHSSLFEPVGIFATKCGIYLQHPRYCNRDVPYRNPHCLSLEDGKSLSTYDLPTQLSLINSETLPPNPIDVLLDAGQQEHLSEAPAPDTVKTPLYKHQRQALMFMMERETGWAMDGRYKDIWKAEVDVQGQKVYVNSISGQRQIRPPDQFRGGLLIDAPGLGKSLSIIALIAADLDSRGGHTMTPGAKSQTLLVVPKSLIQTWKDELEKYAHPQSHVTAPVMMG